MRLFYNGIRIIYFYEFNPQGSLFIFLSQQSFDWAFLEIGIFLIPTLTMDKNICMISVHNSILL